MLLCTKYRWLSLLWLNAEYIKLTVAFSGVQRPGFQLPGQWRHILSDGQCRKPKEYFDCISAFVMGKRSITYLLNLVLIGSSRFYSNSLECPFQLHGLTDAGRIRALELENRVNNFGFD